MYAKILIVFLLIVGLVLVPATPASAAEGDLGWSPATWFPWLLNNFKFFVQAALCKLRVAVFNAIGAYFCVQCEVDQREIVEIPEEGGEGGSGGSSCHDIEGCECALCPGWLSEYKMHIVDTLSWVVGAGNVLQEFIPWQLWATLYVAYLNAAAFLWAVRMVSKLGLMMFGVVT